MRVFSTRAALVAFWLMSAGLTLVPFSLVAFVLFDPYDINLIGSAAQNGQAPSWFYFFMALLGLGAFIAFCVYRIYRDLVREMPNAASMRAKTEQGRTLAALCFGVGAVLGVYGFVTNGAPVYETLVERADYAQATAKLISKDKNPALLDGKETISGGYVFYTKDRTRIELDGITPLKFSDPRVKPGSTFSVKYKKSNPTDHEFGTIPHIAYYGPSVLALIFLFWMISAGLTGCIENLKSGDKRGKAIKHYKPSKPRPHKGRASRSAGFGTRGNQ